MCTSDIYNITYNDLIDLLKIYKDINLNPYEIIKIYFHDNIVSKTQYNNLKKILMSITDKEINNNSNPINNKVINELINKYVNNKSYMINNRIMNHLFNKEDEDTVILNELTIENKIINNIYNINNIFIKKYYYVTIEDINELYCNNLALIKYEEEMNEIIDRSSNNTIIDVLFDYVKIYSMIQKSHSENNIKSLSDNIKTFIAKINILDLICFYNDNSKQYKAVAVFNFILNEYKISYDMKSEILNKCIDLFSKKYMTFNSFLKKFIENCKNTNDLINTMSLMIYKLYKNNDIILENDIKDGIEYYKDCFLNNELSFNYSILEQISDNIESISNNVRMMKVLYA